MTPQVIRVVCAALSHADRPVVVGAFRRIDGSWVDHGRRTGAALDGDQVADTAHVRLRFRLRCRACGLSVPVRHERLAPVLDRLEAADVDTVSLTGLAGIVSGQ